MDIDFREVAERCKLIRTKLNQMMPIPADAGEYLQEGLRRERRRIMIKAGWWRLPIEELRLIARSSTTKKAPA